MVIFLWIILQTNGIVQVLLHLKNYNYDARSFWDIIIRLLLNFKFLVMQRLSSRLRCNMQSTSDVPYYYGIWFISLVLKKVHNFTLLTLIQTAINKQLFTQLTDIVKYPGATHTWTWWRFITFSKCCSRLKIGAMASFGLIYIISGLNIKLKI